MDATNTTPPGEPQSRSAGFRSSLRPHATALAVYLLLTIGVTFPLVFCLGDHIVADPQSDIWAHLWGYWRTEKALLVDHELPARVEYINFPHGGVLYHIDLLNSLMVLPLKKSLGMVAGYNVLVGAQLVFAAFAAFLLAYHLLGRTLPAILAGAVYGFSPYVTSMGLASGVSERLNLAWIPLYVWFVLLAARSGKVRYSALAGVMCLLTAMGCYKYGIFLAIFSVVLFTYLLAGPIVRRLRSSTEAVAEHGRELRQRIKAVALTAGFCIVSCVPLGLFARWLTLDSSALFHRDAMIFWDGSRPLSCHPPFRLADFVLPTDSIHRMTEQYDVLYQDTYLGATLLLLGFFSVFSRRRHVRFFFPATLLFLVLAIGPEPTGHGGLDAVLSLVYKGFARVVPFFTFLDNPWEMVLMASCCLAVAAGGALHLLQERLRGRVAWIVPGALVALLASDYFLLRPTPIPAPLTHVEVSEFYRTLPDSETQYAVFDLPPYRPCSRLRPEEYLFFQTIHRKPIPYAINESWLEGDPFWGALVSYQQCNAATFTPGDVETWRALQFLADSQFRYIALHEDLMSPDGSRTLSALFSRHLGSPVFRDAHLVVYQLQESDP